MTVRDTIPGDSLLKSWLAGEPGAVAWVGPDGCYRSVSPALGALLGLADPEPLQGAVRVAALRERLVPRLRDPAPLEAYLARLESGQAAETVLYLEWSDGTVHDYHSRPLLEPHGQLLGWRESFLTPASLAQLLEEKDQLVARVSHELRTPMTAIMGFCHMLLHYSGELTPRQDDYVHKVLKNASILLQLINNVLDISKINTGAVSVMPERIDLVTSVAEAVETVEPQTWEKDLPIRVALDADLPEILTDRLKLKQILINLLANAVKYTDAGSVTVEGRAAEGGVVIEVVDTGIGIPADQCERIFEPYTQLETGATGRRRQGSGLGLAICRRLTTLLGGRLTVASEPGAGSRFTLQMPLQPPDPPAIAAEPGSAPAA